MKQLNFKVLIVVLLVSFLPGSGWSQHVVANLKNNPLPKHPETLKILGIGNSFTDDGMAYLPDLLESAGVKNVTLGRLVIGGCSLEKHYRLSVSHETAYTYYKSYPGKNRWEKSEEKISLLSGLADENWDVIIIQQVSGNSGFYETYQPYLNELISVMRVNCPNAGVTLGWHMTWAYATGAPGATRWPVLGSKR